MTEETAVTTPAIAIVSHGHPDLSRGGAEVSAYALYTALKAAGHRAIFVAVCPEAEMVQVQPRAGEYLLPREDDAYDFFYHIGTPALVDRLTAILRAEGVEVVNFHHYLFLGINAVAATVAMGLRTYVTLHEYLAICQHHGQMVTRPDKTLCRRASRVACRACFPEHMAEEFDLRADRFRRAFAGVAGFISPSHFLRDRYAVWGLDPARVHVVENGLSDVEARLAELSGEGHSHGRTGLTTVGYFGQITPFKGVDVILDAMALVAERRGQPGGAPAPFRIRIHGNLIGLDPAFVEEFEAAVKAHPELHYAGAYANTDVLRLMRDCDYVLVPSRWWENSPVVIQEAFAAGCPVIASDLGGLAEKVADGTSGLLFRMGDPVSLLAALDQASDPQTRARLRAGLPPVQRAEDMAARYLAIFGLAGAESPA